MNDEPYLRSRLMVILRIDEQRKDDRRVERLALMPNDLNNE